MTLPDLAPPGKPRRLRLYAPLVLLLAVVVAWSLGWLWLRGQVLGRLEGARRTSVGLGYQLGWQVVKVSGFPFRLDVDVAEGRLADRSGAGISAPRLKAEAFVFAPSHWVVVAPDGVVIARRSGGPIIVRAKVLRASLFELARRPPRLSVEGAGLSFTTPTGGKAFFLTEAAGFHLHTRAGPDDQGAVHVAFDRAAANLFGIAGRIAAGRPVELIADGVYTHAEALAGRDWATAVSSWSAAGGELRLSRLLARAGDAALNASSGVLTVGRDGRLRGSLTLRLTRAPRALTVLGQTGAIAPEAVGAATSVISARARGPAATVTLDFEAGRTTLGPAAIGPAPRIY